MENIQITHLPLTDIEVSRTNPRKTFDETELQELAQSIFEKGVLQPILVRASKKPGKYEIIAGERRYRASLQVKTLNKDRNTIPAIIREMNDEEALEVQIIENLQRKDVHPMEEAVGFLHLITIKKMDVKEIAARVGKNASYVAQRLKFNDLIEDIQKVFYSGRIKVKDALQLAAMSKDTQEAIYEDDIKEDGSKEIEFDEWRMRKYRHQLNNAPFDLDDAQIDPKVGACSNCQYNSGYGNLLFPEEAQNPICRNGRCFESKCELNFKIQLAAAIEDPACVLVSGWYDIEHTKEGKELKKKGYDIHNSREYEELRRPECPERDDFDGDNYTEEEDEADYQKALAKYQNDLREYEAEVASGKYTRALKIDESDKGSILYVKITRKGAAKSDTTKPGAAPISEDEAALKAEIDRIKEREKRAKELDSSKIYEALKPHFNPHANASVLKGKLADFEIHMMAMAILEKLDYNMKDGFRKLFKIDGRKLDFSHVDLEMLYQMQRYFLLATIPPPASQPGYDKRLSAAYTIAGNYFPNTLSKIQSEQLDKAFKRNERVEAKIKSLQKKIAEMKKVAQDAKKLASDANNVAPKAKKGKGVKALLPDAE